ncbi:MAG: MmcQ/YjbR family DNA-binding protein [Candidatus Rokuibacteriota bacterium]
MGRESSGAVHQARDGVAALARLRRICLALPGTSEKVSHGEPTFWVGGRMFATFDNHHHGAPHVAVWLAMPLGAQESLVYQDPRHFFVPPYVDVRGWVGVRLDNRPNWKAAEKAVREAHAFIENKNPRPRRGRGQGGGARRR